MQFLHYLFDDHRYSKLHQKGGRCFEKSIQKCMVRQIRNAQRYIYLENQYFLGSVYAWKEDRHTLCNHLIPTEIAQQIATKIELGEPFKCYLVIPMYPEGDTATKPSQEILFLAI
jgi:phospholipase D1/2